MAQVQPTLPFYTPRDRGKLYALRNILAAIEDGLRTQAPVASDEYINRASQVFDGGFLNFDSPGHREMIYLTIKMVN